MNGNYIEYANGVKDDRIERVNNLNLAILLRSIEDKSTDREVKEVRIKMIRSYYDAVCDLQRQVESQPLPAISLRAKIEQLLSVSLTDGSTPVNSAAVNCDITKNLMAIYLSVINGRFDRSYFDEETGVTHFHMACMGNLGGLVWEFLRRGQDPNCVVTKTGDSPLHLTLANGNVGVAELLIKSDANPNLANAQGSTPLHVICNRDDGDDESIDRFLKMCADREVTLQLDARDQMGLTALQLAVVHCLPHAVEVLLAQGADISSFEFPTAAFFTKRFQSDISSVASKLCSVSRVLAVVRNLEKVGLKLKSSDALIIMNYFDWCRLVDKPADLEENLYQQEEFGEKAFTIMINSWLSLYDLIRLTAEDAENLVAYTDYCELSRSEEFGKLPDKYAQACVWRLCDTMARGFFQRYTRLPIGCCEKILKNMSNRDLRNICLAMDYFTTRRDTVQ